MFRSPPAAAGSRLALALVAAALLAGSCSQPEVTETSLGPITEKAAKAHIFTSPHSRHAAYYDWRPPRIVLVIDGRAGPEFERVHDVKLADNGRRAYSALRDGRYFVVHDRGEWGPYESISILLLASADGRTVAFPSKDSAGSYLVVNGRAGERWDEVGSHVLSPDGRLLCYAAARDGQWFVVAGDSRHGPFAGAGAVVMNDDGSRWSCAVQVGDSWALLTDGRLGAGRYERVLFHRLNPDGPGEALIALEGGRVALVHDGRQGPGCDQILPQSVKFSPDFRHHAYIARSGDRTLFVADGVEGPVFDAPAGSPVVADGGRWAGVGMVGNQAVVWRDGAELARHERALVFAFSVADGRLAWATGDSGQWFARVGDEWSDGPFHELRGNVKFSPDGRRFAFAANTGRDWVVVADGRRSASYDDFLDCPGLLDPQGFFTPDGRHFAYAAQRNGRAVLVIDGKEVGPTYDRIREMVFEGNDRVNFLAVRSGILLAVSRRLSD